METSQWKERDFQRRPDIGGQELQPETAPSYLRPSGRNAGRALNLPDKELQWPAADVLGHFFGGHPVS